MPPRIQNKTLLGTHVKRLIALMGVKHRDGERKGAAVRKQNQKRRCGEKSFHVAVAPREQPWPRGRAASRFTLPPFNPSSATNAAKAALATLEVVRPCKIDNFCCPKDVQGLIAWEEWHVQNFSSIQE